MKCEIEYWDNIRKACKYPLSDNNDGYIYGINLLDENDEIIDVEWFKTEKERFEVISKYKLEIVNEGDYR